MCFWLLHRDNFSEWWMIHVILIHGKPFQINEIICYTQSMYVFAISSYEPYLGACNLCFFLFLVHLSHCSPLFQFGSLLPHPDNWTFARRLLIHRYLMALSRTKLMTCIFFCRRFEYVSIICNNPASIYYSHKFRLPFCTILSGRDGIRSGMVPRKTECPSQNYLHTLPKIFRSKTY